MKILECSSDGDKRFSAFCAYIRIYGRYDSIENHYQNSKQFRTGRPDCVKGIKPDYIVIANHEFDVKYLTSFYKLLWVKYLDTHPNLIKYASKFDDYSDKFKGKKTINCQSDVIRQYIKEGRESIMNERGVKSLIQELRKYKGDDKYHG